MSARDSESGSSTYKGGSGSAGGLGNGGIGGGMGGGGNYGGGGGGGAGRNAGIGSRTGLTTGTKMVGTPGRDGLSATGRPGGMARNPGAWGMRPQSSIARGTLGAPAVPGLLAEPVPAAVMGEIPAYTPNIFNQDYLNSIVDFRKAMSNRYGWGAAMPGPGPMTAPAPVAPTSWRNPTAHPQWSTGWKNQTDNYSLGNTYPGGLNYTRQPGRDNTWSNDDNRFGIDKMARDRGF